MPTARAELPPIVGRRKRPVHAPREVLVELFGWAADPHFAAVSDIIRTYRTKLGGLVRIMTASVSHAAGFDARPRGTEAGAPWRCSLIVEGATAPLTQWAPDGASATPPQVADAVEQWLLCRFLGWKMLRQVGVDAVHQRRRCCAANDDAEAIPAAAVCGLSDADLIVRPYITETSRSAGYLVASLRAQRAVVIDPGFLDVAAIVADVGRLGLTVQAIVVTHWPSCHALAVENVVQALPSPVETVLSPASDASAFDGFNAGLALGDGYRLYVHRQRAPWTSSEEWSLALSLAVTTATGEMAPVALFSGVVMGVDCPGPTYQPTPAGPDCVDEPYVDAVVMVRRGMLDLLGAAVDSAVLFPGYGGYNNTTHALDLAWMAHVGDISRASPNMIKSVGLQQQQPHATPPTSEVTDEERLNASSLVNFCAALLGLVKAPLADAVMQRNRTLTVQRTPLSTSPPAPVEDVAAFLARSPDGVAGARNLVLDLRLSPLQAFRSGASVPCVADALMIPMGHDVPLRFATAKRAELWTSTILAPTDAPVIIVESEEHLASATARLTFAGAGVVDATCFITTRMLHEAHAANPAGTVITLAPAAGMFGRLSSYEAASAALVPASADSNGALSDTVIVDIRAPYEFRNGSHASSVSWPLTDVRPLVAAAVGAEHGGDAELPFSNFRAAAGAAAWATPQELRSLLSDAARKVVLYCAGGYRSFIALSILAAAQRRLSPPATLAVPAAPRLFDVPGGALQLMLKHADFWMVKDRNVICVS